MKQYFKLLFLSAMVVACGTPKHDHPHEADSTESSPVTVAPSAATENILTDAEKSEGWKLLFDGNSMQGWRTYKNAENDSWEVIDGTLHCKPFKDNETNKRADILTTEQFGNFELTFEWKVASAGNTGLMYKVTEEFKEPYESGPEFQLLDDAGWPGDLEKWQLTGSCYGMIEPAERKLNPAGEWNQGRLLVKDNHVEHWVNGTKVVEYELHSDHWKKRKSQSKWKDAAGYGLAKQGHIDLQDHQNEAWFRNIKIRTL